MRPLPGHKHTCLRLAAFASAWSALLVSGAQAQPTDLQGKTPLTDYDLARKREGAYLTGLPIVDSDPDTGFGLGARVYRYWNGTREDPLFAYTPYRHAVFAQVFFTTNGYQEHLLSYDAPYFLDSPFRLRATASLDRNTSANYFGRGASTLHALSFPAAGRSFPTFDAYASALRQLRLGDVGYTLYNKYEYVAPGVAASLEHDLFGGRVRVQAGGLVSSYQIRDLTGSATTGDDPTTGRTDLPAMMGTTKLRADCDAGRILGCGGGMHNLVRLGIALDTRDYEPDPNSGAMAEAVVAVSSRALGSDYDYVRLTASSRVFFSPFPEAADLVLAGRAVYSMQSAGTPFFAMSTLAFTDSDRYGLGGLWTIRGYKQDRFVGANAALANVELRWTFVDFDVAGQGFALAAAPFFDAGRVFDRVRDFSLADWRLGGGAGLHVAWNKATILVFDYGVSREDAGLYMDFGQQF
jgi:outer membrane protein assembly factor BamA